MKKLIHETHGHPPETLKLIAYGKIMDDDAKTVTDYKIAEDGFIVMMTVKVSDRAAATRSGGQVPTSEARRSSCDQLL